ncbi:hypothetical protein GCM10027047_32000 [Rhodococcus aerolatus]
MSAVLDVVSAVLLISGSALALTAAIGLLRFPDVATRMHAGTKPQTLGLLLVLLGTALQLGSSIDLGLLVLAGLFQLITAPLVGQRLGRVAYLEGEASQDLLVVDEWARDREAAAADAEDDARSQAGAPERPEA